jgi:hypothetical protein
LALESRSSTGDFNLQPVNLSVHANAKHGPATQTSIHEAKQSGRTVRPDRDDEVGEVGRDTRVVSHIESSGIPLKRMALEDDQLFNAAVLDQRFTKITNISEGSTRLANRSRRLEV